MKLSDAREGEYVVSKIDDDYRLMLYQLGIVEGSVIDVEIKTRSAIVLNLKPLGRIGIPRSLGEHIEVEPV